MNFLKFFAILSFCIISASTTFSKHFKITVNKRERKLYVYQNDSLVKTYTIALGSSPTGKKEKEGDRKTPEGQYYIMSKNAHSAFYLALGISYPNIHDAERGLQSGIISQKDFRRIQTALNAHHAPPQNTPLGGDVFIHGNGIDKDWTWGCIAMEDRDVKELFDEIPIGTPLKINP